jgi:hypothetical protein
MSDVLLLHALTGALKIGLAYSVPTLVLFRRRPSLRTGVTLGLFVALARVISRVLARRLSSDSARSVRSDGGVLDAVRRYRNLVAGALSAALTLLLVEPSAPPSGALRRSSLLASAALVRAVRSAVPFSHPALPVVVMCVSASQVLSAWLAAPHEHMDGRYRQFLNVFGGKAGESAVPLPMPDGSTSCHRVYAAMNAWSTSKTPLPPGVAACDVIHGGDGRACFTHFAKFTLHGLRRAAPMYGALHTAFVLVRVVRQLAKKDDRKRPLPERAAHLLSAELAPLLVRIGKSSLFLALYCSTAWLSACMAYRHLYGHVSRATLASHTWVAGLPVLLESPSRQLELASYCAVYAVDTTWRQLNAAFGRSSARPDLVIATLVASAGVLLHNHAQHGGVVNWILELD